MNGRIAKKLRKAVGYSRDNENPVMRRTYRRYKKLYTSLPDAEKYKVFNTLNRFSNNTTKNKK
ncbi:hypothetical protein N9955_01040 [bacterium]|nr:hypothetical protein [bacterium]